MSRLKFARLKVKPLLSKIYLFDKIILLLKNLFIFVATKWELLEWLDEVLSNDQFFLLLIYVSLSIEIWGNFMIIFLQFLKLFANDSINLLLGFIDKLSKYLHNSLEIFLFLHFSFNPIGLEAFKKATNYPIQAIDLVHVN